MIPSTHSPSTFVEDSLVSSALHSSSLTVSCLSVTWLQLSSWDVICSARWLSLAGPCSGVCQYLACSSGSASCESLLIWNGPASMLLNTTSPHILHRLGYNKNNRNTKSGWPINNPISTLVKLKVSKLVSQLKFI